MEILARNLKHARVLSGITQVELARLALMDRSQVNGLENGTARSYPKPETLAKIARVLNREVDELTGKVTLRQATPYETNPTYRRLIDLLEAVELADRDQIVSHALWASERARPRVASTNLRLFPSSAEENDFPPLPDDIGRLIEKDTDTPRPLHAWIVPIDAEAAAGLPRQEDDWLIPTTQLLNSVREVRDDRTKVVKVFGDSMHPTLRNGWKVLLDPSRALFQPGKIVVVYIRDEGTTMGVLARSGERFWIQKRNLDYGGPSEIPLREGEWYPVGTVTTIVEAPVVVE